MGLVIWRTFLYLNMMSFSRYIPSHGEAVRIILAGSSSPCSGRVEIYHNNSWGTVCDDYWDLKDAEVVCRELNCGTAQSAPGNAHFGRGYGPVFMIVSCSGNETSLTQCRYFGRGDCDHSEDAGVVCSDSLMPRPMMVGRTVGVGCVLLLLLLLLTGLWLIHRKTETKKTDDTACVMNTNNTVGRGNDNDEVYADAEACHQGNDDHSDDYVNGNVHIDNLAEEEEEEEYDDIDEKEEVNYVTVIG